MHKRIAVAALALALGVTPILGAEETASGNTASSTPQSTGDDLTKHLLPWIEGLGIPSLLLAWLNRSGKGLPGLRKKRSPKELEILSSATFSQAIETDLGLKELVSEARHALVFETAFGARAEAGSREALTAFWKESNGRFTMPEIGQAAAHVRWNCGEFTYRGLIARRYRERLGRLRRWTRDHFLVISLLALVALGAFIFFDVRHDLHANREFDFDLLDIGVACYIILAAVLGDLWLRKLEVIDELVEWSRRAKAISGDPSRSRSI